MRPPEECELPEQRDLTLQYHFVAVSLIVQERRTKGLMRPTRTGRLADRRHGRSINACTIPPRRPKFFDLKAVDRHTVISDSLRIQAGPPFSARIVLGCSPFNCGESAKLSQCTPHKKNIQWLSGLSQNGRRLLPERRG